MAYDTIDYIADYGLLVLDSGALRSWEYQMSQFDLALMPGQKREFFESTLADHLESFSSWLDEIEAFMSSVVEPSGLDREDTLFTFVSRLQDLYAYLADLDPASWDIDTVRDKMERINNVAPDVSTVRWVNLA